VVEPFVRTWVFAASLQEGPGEFELSFKKRELEDRNPAPGAEPRDECVSGEVQNWLS
jgi:hypothetical protein